MINKLQILSINILIFKYKNIIILLAIVITNLLLNTNSLVYCSLEENDEYIRFLEEQCWELDKQISDQGRRIHLLETKIEDLGQSVEDLKQTVAEQKVLIETQQQLLTQTQAKASETKL